LFSLDFGEASGQVLVKVAKVHVQRIVESLVAERRDRHVNRPSVRRTVLAFHQAGHFESIDEARRTAVECTMASAIWFILSRPSGDFRSCKRTSNQASGRSQVDSSSKPRLRDSRAFVSSSNANNLTFSSLMAGARLNRHNARLPYASGNNYCLTSSCICNYTVRTQAILQNRRCTMTTTANTTTTTGLPAAACTTSTPSTRRSDSSPPPRCIEGSWPFH